MLLEADELFWLLGPRRLRATDQLGFRCRLKVNELLVPPVDPRDKCGKKQRPSHRFGQVVGDNQTEDRIL